MSKADTTATQSLNKKEQASLQMRATILATTIEILGTEGYAEVTASNLSNKAGISKGALYHHFANLDEIRFAALALLIEQLMTTDDPARYKNLQDFLDTAGEEVFAMMKEHRVAIRALYVFVTRALVDDVIKEQMQVLVKHAIDQYLQALRYFCPELTREERTALTWVVDAYYAGSILQWHVMDDPAACRTSWQQFTSLVTHYVTGKQRG